jgi:hypothetical protein
LDVQKGTIKIKGGGHRGPKKEALHFEVHRHTHIKCHRHCPMAIHWASNAAMQSQSATEIKESTFNDGLDLITYGQKDYQQLQRT